ncbi:hypothetical protein GPL21_40795 [Bradyrhizobium pachyrhizi]|uniref:Cytochrome c domain-containing protein n=1 Tax=Bradyrhizobium pachyrhizi TaxID=280333 RepID=A0A844T4H5_9BRAD|nr:hypothetical protein [Bradyrhizobium pachyrhizi]MVT71329.1 hypothetical protein [Bradyrhizobium pachyrhizi]
MIRFPASVSTVFSFFAAVCRGTAIPTSASSFDACSTGSRCLSVDTNGKVVPQPGPFVAQCTGRFPDYIVNSSHDAGAYTGPWFLLSQNYPTTPPQDSYPWLKIDFSDVDRYLYALRDYSFEGMIESDFRPERNSVRPWFHMPLMTYGPPRREPIRGLTEERSVTGPELGVKPNVTIRNFAIGFYNAPGATTIGTVWASANPNLAAARFAEGTASFKILFSNAKPEDFTDSSADPMTGAPEFTILTDKGLQTLRLLQMDVAAVDSRAPTGWVFGTFAFDKTATDAVSWKRLRPVGMSWGNDENYTPADRAAGKKLTESGLSSQIPGFALKHLGWAGRPNGPVDNPASGCLSCHGTAEFPVAAALGPFSNKCDTDAKRLFWFRNFRGDTPFGAVDPATCEQTMPAAELKSLDFSLQMKVAVQNAVQFKVTNPCAPTAPLDAEMRSAAPYSNAPRVGR